MNQSDAIREYAFKHYVVPARQSGQATVQIRAGEVHKAMGLSARLPAVCSALGTNKFQQDYGLTLVSRTGPSNGSTTLFTFNI